jgi:hypothetical protein
LQAKHIQGKYGQSSRSRTKKKEKKEPSRRLGKVEELPPTTNQIEVEDFVDCPFFFSFWQQEAKSAVLTVG